MEKRIVGKVIMLDLYLLSMYQPKKSDKRIPLIIPGFNMPGKKGVANEDTTLIIGIIKMNKNKLS